MVPAALDGVCRHLRGGVETGGRSKRENGGCLSPAPGSCGLRSHWTQLPPGGVGAGPGLLLGLRVPCPEFGPESLMEPSRLVPRGECLLSPALGLLHSAAGVAALKASSLSAGHSAASRRCPRGWHTTEGAGVSDAQPAKAPVRVLPFPAVSAGLAQPCRSPAISRSQALGLPGGQAGRHLRCLRGPVWNGRLSAGPDPAGPPLGSPPWGWSRRLGQGPRSRTGDGGRAEPSLWPHSPSEAWRPPGRPPRLAGLLETRSPGLSLMDLVIICGH